jgi:hypothetical protein
LGRAIRGYPDPPGTDPPPELVDGEVAAVDPEEPTVDVPVCVLELESA